jgi:hypothetical protein
MRILSRPSLATRAVNIGRKRSSTGIYGKRVSGKPIATAVRQRSGRR